MVSVRGRRVWIFGVPFRIIGVTPPEFYGVEVGAAPDIFVPFMMQPTVQPAFENLIDNPIVMRSWCLTLARLKPGVYPPQAAAALDAVYRQVNPPEPQSMKPTGALEWKVSMSPAATGLSDLRSRFSQALFILMAVVRVGFFVARAHTPHPLFGRAPARRPERALPLAPGAKRGSTIR